MIKVTDNRIGSGSGESPIARPIDPYSPLWPAYWAQNPHLGRGVGADAAGGEGDAGGGEGDGGDAGADDIETLRREAAEAKRLREENELFKKKHNEAEKHRKEQERVARDAATELAKKNGDWESWQKSKEELHQAEISAVKESENNFRGMVEELTAGSTASTICNSIAMEGCAPALMPHVRARLKSEIVDGKPVTRVLDAQGNISAMTPDDLIKELKATPYLAPLIIGSKASGAGNPGGKGNGGDSKEMSRSDFDKLDPFKKREFSLKGGRVVD